MWSWKDILTPRTPTPDAILDFGLTIFQEGVWEGSKTDAQGIPMWTRLSGAHNLDQIFKQTSRGLIADLKQTSSGLQDAFQQASIRFQAICKTSSGHQVSQIISFSTTGQHVKKNTKRIVHTKETGVLNLNSCHYDTLWMGAILTEKMTFCRDKCLTKAVHTIETGVLIIPTPVKMTPCPLRLQLHTL